MCLYPPAGTTLEHIIKFDLSVVSHNCHNWHGLDARLA